MKIRKSTASLILLVVMPFAAACSTGTTAAESGQVSGVTSEGNPGREGGGGDVSSVSTEAELIALVQSAYGEANLDLHRGHQPVQDVLDEILVISHEELHVRMDDGQNLAAVATELGVDPNTLVTALAESWSPGIDGLLDAGEITEAEATQYRAALTEAFTFRVNWNGEDSTPTFSGLGA